MRSHARPIALSLLVVGLALAGLLAAALPRPAEAAAAAKRKLAMIMPGSIQDADFNAAGYVALQDLAKTYDLQVSHSESVAVVDAERVVREYISAGFEIILLHGSQYPTVVQKLAPLFPNVTFIYNAQGRVPNTPTNVWVLGRRWYQGFYALGAVAALSTKADKVGFMGGVRVPDVIESTNAVQQAIKDYNPKAQFIYTHVGDFNDPVKARQATEAQIAGGVDFIVCFINLGFYGVVEAVKAAPRPVLLTTFITDKANLAPNNLVVSLLAVFSTPYKEMVGKVLQGERTGYYEMRPGSGMELSDLRNVSPEVAAKAKAVFAEVVAGKPIPQITDRVVSP